jgi:pyridoxamine 5'-phosphate oxidase-like protein
MTLATADERGRPWVSPVFYAVDGYRDFYWISSPEVTHYRARVSQHSVLCPRSAGPCADHGRAFDHRTPVTL